MQPKHGWQNKRRAAVSGRPSPKSKLSGAALMGLTAQESRDLELIVFERVVHRSLTAVLVEALRRRPRGRRTLGIFGHLFGCTRLSLTWQRRHRLCLGHRWGGALGSDRHR